MAFRARVSASVAAAALAAGAIATVVPASSGAAAAGACAAPRLVSSMGTNVNPGVHNVHTLTYTAVLDDACLDSSGTVTVELYRDGIGWADRRASYTGLQGSYQVWQARFTLDPLHSAGSDIPLYVNDFAGIWDSLVQAPGTSAPATFQGDALLVRRFSEIQGTNAYEPVPKGAKETVTGKLARADWEDHRYHGNAGQPVELQFRTLTGHYATLKTIDSDASGLLRTTTTATVDGCYRWYFAGNDDTPPATAPGDCVNVT